MWSERVGRMLNSTAFRATVSLGLLGWLLHGHADVLQLSEDLRTLAVTPLLIAIVLSLLGRFLVAARWHSVLRLAGVRISSLELARTLFVSSAIGAVAPGASLTEALRVYAVSRRTGIATAVSTTVLERAFAFAIMGAAGAVGLLLTEAVWPAGVTIPAACLMLAPLLFLGLAVGMAPRLSRWLEWLAAIAPGLHALRSFLDITTELRGRPGTLLVMIALTAVMQGVRIATTWAIALSVGIELSPGLLLLIAPAAFYASQLPVSILGLGVREVTLVAILGAFGVSASMAVVIGLLHVAVFIISIFVPGLLLYFIYGVSLNAEGSRTAPVG